MNDEVSTGELARRLDRIEILLQGQVSRNEYTTAHAYTLERFTSIEQDIADLRRVHEKDVEDIRRKASEERTASGSNFRQGIYGGALPAIFLLIGLLVTILLAFKGGK